MNIILQISIALLCLILLSNCVFFSKPHYSSNRLCEPVPTLASPRPDYSNLSSDLKNKTYDEIYKSITSNHCNRKLKDGVLVVSGFGVSYELEGETALASTKLQRAKERALFSAYMNAENAISKMILFDNYTIERLFYPGLLVHSDIQAYIRSNKNYRFENLDKDRIRVDLYLDNFYESISKIIVKHSKANES